MNYPNAHAVFGMSNKTKVICQFCGETRRAELLEIFQHERTFLVGESCCELFNQQISSDGYLASKFFADEIEQIIGERPRGITFSNGMNYKLKIKSISQADAKAFIRKHHRHNRPPAGWRYGAGIWNGDIQIGVIMVGRPVARRIDHHSTLEVNRLCIDPNIDSELSMNACSQLYAWATREGKKRGFQKIITYTLTTEKGASLKASGWSFEEICGGGTWHREYRPRKDGHPTIKKVRWSKQLIKKANQIAA